MLCFSVFLINVHNITLIDSGYLDLGHLSMLQSTRCDVLIGHLWITGEALELRMWQTSICQQHDLQVAGVFLKKKLGKGWVPGRQEQVFNEYFNCFFFFFCFTCQELCQNLRLVHPAFLPPYHLPQNHMQRLSAWLMPHLPCSPGKYTSLCKHIISFDVCLRALMYLKGFFKVHQHFPWAFSVGFFHFPIAHHSWDTAGYLNIY